MMVTRDKAGPGASRRRLLRALAGAVLVLLFAPFSYKVQGRLETAVHIQGGEAENVEQELSTHFKSPFVHRVVLVMQGLPNPDSASGSRELGIITDAVRAQAGVSGVISRLDSSDEMFAGTGGGTLAIVGLQASNVLSEEELIPRLRSRLSQLQEQLRTEFPNVRLDLTGELPLNFDLRKVSADDVDAAESRALPVTLLLLFMAFGSLVAALLPLGAGILAISMTLGAAAFLANYLHLSILVQNLATMLGLGLGVDYGLLMVARFREALADGYSGGAAADLAGRQAGRVLLLSASTVAIGFASLLWVPISELRSIGVAGLLVAVMSVMLCTLILPWVLGLLGERINAGSIRSLRGLLKLKPQAITAQDRWRRWGMIVTARPWVAILLAGGPLVLLSLQATKISTGLPDDKWLPQGAESVRALNSLERMDRSGIVESLRIIVELPAGSDVNSVAGWGGITRLTQYLKNDPRAAEIVSLPTLTDMAETSEDLELLPETTRQSFLRDDGRAALFEVLPKARINSSEEIAWVNELRSRELTSIMGLPGVNLRIGGIPAANADYEAVVHERMPRVIAAVVGGSFLALLIGFRSLLVAIKAVTLNLLSVGASFGALVLVFQMGYGSSIFGVPGGVAEIFPMIPVLSFAIVFGLSMDYEVFLVARVLEERRRGLSERAAVAEGMASTARLITSAASIMIAVFAAFTMGSFLVVKMLGFTLAIAVVIDATLVRMVIGPALLQLAGDWNWWPGGLSGSSPISQTEETR